MGTIQGQIQTMSEHFQTVQAQQEKTSVFKETEQNKTVCASLHLWATKTHDRTNTNWDRTNSNHSSTNKNIHEQKRTMPAQQKHSATQTPSEWSTNEADSQMMYAKNRLWMRHKQQQKNASEWLHNCICPSKKRSNSWAIIGRYYWKFTSTTKHFSNPACCIDASSRIFKIQIEHKSNNNQKSFMNIRWDRKMCGSTSKIWRKRKHKIEWCQGELQKWNPAISNNPQKI